MQNTFSVKICKTQKTLHLSNRLWDRPVQDSGYLSWIHADPSFGYHITDESHFVFVELALFHLGVELVFTQDLKNEADVLGVKTTPYSP